ncbi:hypothetical protein N7449_003057, partial [Penicillium cf. viridicatum]
PDLSLFSLSSLTASDIKASLSPLSNKKQTNAEPAEAKMGEAEVPMPELPVGARDGRSELRGDTYMRWELPADHKREIPELDSGRNR